MIMTFRRGHERAGTSNTNLRTRATVAGKRSPRRNPRLGRASATLSGDTAYPVAQPSPGRIERTSSRWLTWAPPSIPSRRFLAGWAARVPGTVRCVKKLVELILCILHPIAVVLIWIDLLGRSDLGSVAKLTWAVAAIVPIVPFVYVLTGNDFI